MNIVSADQTLAQAGFRAPELAALVPDVNNYSVLLAQPQGLVEADATGVRNRDQVRAQAVFSGFLKKAVETAADLAVTPEYALPWATFVAALRADVRPAAGKLWALGCESLTLAELVTYQTELANIATVIFEPMTPQANRFLDPLVYVFHSEPLAGGPGRLVLLVQFKTHPMGDPYENEHLHCGTAVYQFGDAANGLRLISLICSDAFAFTDEQAAAVHHRSLVLHIQLNQKPRQHQYRQYREKLFYYNGDEIELLCLNWAGGVCEWSDGEQKPWNNPSGSAWYLRPKEFDTGDTTLCANHKHGLYYTRLESSRAHVLFLNYSAGAYLLEATKVAHTAVPASTSRRVGPKLQQVFVWDPASGALSTQASAADGFPAILVQAGNAQGEIQRIYQSSPIAAERVLALCAGKIAAGEWYKVAVLDSFGIATTEIICRITFCQDVVQEASEFRSARLLRCANLWQILEDKKNMPPALADLGDGWRLEWQATHPHQNVMSTADKPGTAIYLGEDADDAMIERVATCIAENLRRGAANDNDAVTARQRVAIWYRRGGELLLHDPDRYRTFDDPRNASALDLTRQN